MEILQQKAELLPELDNLYLQIARRGKICYRREDTATEEGAQAFTLDKLKKRHTTCLEQAQVYIFVPAHPSFVHGWTSIRYNDLKFLQITHRRYYRGETGLIISGSIWAFYQAFHLNPCGTPVDEAIYGALQSVMPDVFNRAEPSRPFSLLNRKEVILALPGDYEKHVRRAIRFRTNRAISHQLVRHRVFSILQESQRYCRYDRGVEFIEDPDISASENQWPVRTYHYQKCEQAYKAAIVSGLTAQKARGVLPQDTATRLIMNGTLADWKHLFRLRLGSGADPMIKRLCRMAVDEFIKAGYGEAFEEFV